MRILNWSVLLPSPMSDRLNATYTVFVATLIFALHGDKNIKANVKFELDNFPGDENIDLTEWENIEKLTDNSDFTGKLRLLKKTSLKD